MATVVAAHDLSGLGRCSLVAAISVLGAMGHSPVPLPTAVLSQQTAFPGHTYLDLTGEMAGHLAAWDRDGFQPDAIFSGFLGSGAQTGMLARYVSGHPDAVLFVDPVMGDHGALYPCYDGNFVTGMREFAKQAHLLTPNPTEFLLLAGSSPDSALPNSEKEWWRMAERLRGPRLHQLVVTGVTVEGETCNLLLDYEKSRFVPVPCHHTGVAYSGSGDLFASVLCGAVASGMDAEEGIRLAGKFLSRVALSMAGTPADPRLGMSYEPFLHLLMSQDKGR